MPAQRYNGLLLALGWHIAAFAQGMFQKSHVLAPVDRNTEAQCIEMSTESGKSCSLNCIAPHIRGVSVSS